MELYDCDLAGLLQNGKGAQNQQWPRNGRRNGRGPFFGVVPIPKWPAGQMAGRLKFGDFLPVRPVFGHFGNPPPPKNGRRPFRRLIFRHFCL